MPDVWYCLIAVSALLALMDYSAPLRLRMAISLAHVILSMTWISIILVGERLTKPGTLNKIKAVLLMLIMGLFAWTVGVGFLILSILLGYLSSGWVLLCRAQKSLKDLALLVFALILMLVARLITLTTATTLTTPIAFITLLTFIGRVVVFWGVIEVARELIYPFAEERCYGGRPHSHSTLAMTATVLFVVLFGLSIFTQEMEPVYFTGQNLLSMTVESQLPDFAFVAGVVMAALKLIAGRVREIYTREF